ncbi:hypothetical protein ALC53_11850 [Atta colombica]|uniref:Uncharacterized protein n=1 Tax=Atta colombica TaxID=520822 RepID=A0A195B0W0_9HYME|nr:hypothetical protein ALC53_11850 [Atta colombica]
MIEMGMSVYLRQVYNYCNQTRVRVPGRAGQQKSQHPRHQRVSIASGFYYAFIPKENVNSNYVIIFIRNFGTTDLLTLNSKLNGRISPPISMFVRLIVRPVYNECSIRICTDLSGRKILYPGCTSIPRMIYTSNVYNTVTFLLHVCGIEIITEAAHAASQSNTSSSNLTGRFEFLLHLCQDILHSSYLQKPFRQSPQFHFTTIIIIATILYKILFEILTSEIRLWKKLNTVVKNCMLTSSSFCKRSLSVSDILFSKCGPESLFSLL